MCKIIITNKSISELYNTINEAYGAFVIYDFLRKMQGTKRRVIIFNKHALLFSYIRNIALYDFTLRITKVMDPPQTGNYENLTLPFLRKSININNKNIKNTIDQLFNNINEKIPELIILRNKHLAHLDRTSNRNELFSKTDTLTVKKILNNQLKLLNIFKSILEKKHRTLPLYFDLESKDIGMLWKDLFILSKMMQNHELGSIF